MGNTAANPFGIGWFMHNLARFLFWITGWKAEGSRHDPARFVLIAAPHTSNWDAVIMLTAAYIFKIKLSWFLKAEAFFWPLGPIVRFFGGVPVDRSSRHNLVAHAARQFEGEKPFVLAVPPEGTRKRAPHWKSGFYYIALSAKVPIVLGYIDYKRKVAGLGRVFVPTGDIEKDFEVLRNFYETITPKFPKNYGPVLPPPKAAREDAAPAKTSAAG